MAEAQSLSHEQLWAVCRLLETDYAPWGHIGDDQRGPDCSCGCRWFHELEGIRGLDWGCCGNPKSPRAGLLTFEHQSGACCGFEAEPYRDEDHDDDRL